MRHGAMLTTLIVCIAMQPAAAEPFHREDLRIPMEAAGARVLEAMLLRPSGHAPLSARPDQPRRTARCDGAGADVADRSFRQALEFARRDFAAPVFMRRGYGYSGGQYAESSGPCERRNHLRAARAIAVGVSAGGFARRRSAQEAAEAALAACAEYAPDCALYAVDDHLAETANAGSR
jgi:hypothetical protein